MVEARIEKSRFYFGQVSHQRRSPVKNRFCYRLFFCLFDLDEIADLAKHNRLFSYNRFGPLSFWDKDHGAKDGTNLYDWIKKILRDGGYDFTIGTVQLQCFPRIFGFAFNPLSVWYCYDTDDNLNAILYEVRNTFGEWRGYLLAAENVRAGGVVRQVCDKEFYVSPLMDMKCRYHFTVRVPDERLLVGICETLEEDVVLLARQTGIAAHFCAKNIRRALLKYPLLYFKIIIGIHLEAVKIFFKGAQFFWNPHGKTGDVIYPGKDDIDR